MVILSVTMTVWCMTTASMIVTNVEAKMTILCMTMTILLMTILWMTINIFLTKILLLKPMKLAPRQIYVSYYDYVVSLKRNCIFYLYFSASNVWTNLSMARRYKCARDI